MQGPGENGRDLTRGARRRAIWRSYGSSDGLALLRREPVVECVAVLRHVGEELTWLKALAAGLGQPVAQIDEGSYAHAVDVRNRAAGKRREAEAEDRADVGFPDIGDHLLLDAAGGFERLDRQQPALEFGNIDRIGIELLLLQISEA